MAPMVLTGKAPNIFRGFLLDINPVDTTLYIAGTDPRGGKYT